MMWVIVRDIVIEDLRRLMRRLMRRPDPPLPYARRSEADPESGRVTAPRPDDRRVS